MFCKAVTSEKVIPFACLWFRKITDLWETFWFVYLQTLHINKYFDIFCPSLSKTAWKNQGLGREGNVGVFSITSSILVNVTHSVLFHLLSSLLKVICKYHDALNSSSKQTNIIFSYLPWTENCKIWIFATPLFFIALALIVHTLLASERFFTILTQYLLHQKTNKTFSHHH